MSRYRSSDDFGGAAAGSLMLFAIIVLVFVMVKLAIFIITTFVRYFDQEKKVLLTSLVVFGALSIVSLVLYALLRADWCGSFVYLGFTQLLITCFVVDLRNRDTLMRPKVNFLNEALNRPWWGSEDKPLQEQEIEPVAA